MEGGIIRYSAGMKGGQLRMDGWGARNTEIPCRAVHTVVQLVSERLGGLSADDKHNNVVQLAGLPKPFSESIDAGFPPLMAPTFPSRVGSSWERKRASKRTHTSVTQKERPGALGAGRGVGYEVLCRWVFAREQWCFTAS